MHPEPLMIPGVELEGPLTLTPQRFAGTTTAGLPVVVEIADFAMIQMGHDAAGRLRDFAAPAVGLAQVVALHQRDEGRRVIAVSERLGRSLADDLAGGRALDEARRIDIATYIGRALATLHEQGIAHGAVSRDAIVFPIALGGEAMLGLPAVVDPDEGSPSDDVRRLLETLELDAPFRDAKMLLAYLATRGTVPEPGTRVDPRERELLDAIVRDPTDEAARMVYADWLDERGDLVRARFLRADAEERPEPGTLGQLARHREVPWRAIVSRARLLGCAVATCPGRWSELGAGSDERTRICGTCTKEVAYCSTRGMMSDRGSRREVAAIDASLEYYEAESSYLRRDMVIRNPPFPR